MRPIDILIPQANRPEAIRLGFCSLPPLGCGQPVTVFRDAASRAEYGISGMCQECQDKMFG